MDSENRNKRDLPEVVADILITLNTVEQRLDRVEKHQERIEQHLEHVEQHLEHMEQHQERIEQHLERLEQHVERIEQNMKDGFDRMVSSFDNMTTAVLDAMNRQTARYDHTQDAQAQQERDLQNLKQRVEGLEKTVYKKAG